MTAYEIGYKAAKENGECIPAMNKELMALLSGVKVGEGEGAELMKQFRNGVNDGIGL